MKKKGSDSQDSSTRFEKLRQQAEDLILNQEEASPDETLNFWEMVHELKIHQVELEIQNEELKRSQNELAELHREFENLYEFAPCGYVTLDPKGIITRANLTAVILMGTTRRFLAGSGFSQYLAPDWNDAYHTARQEATATAEKQSVELLLKSKSKDESPLWVRADIEADLSESGQLIQWRMVLLDISDRRSAEDGKIAVEDQLRHAQKMESVGTLAGGIAHEFNNLLFIIMANNEFLMEQFPEWCQEREHLEDIKQASVRAKDIVKQLLTFSRQDVAAREPQDISLVVGESIKLIQSTMPSNINIVKNIGQDIDWVLCNVTQIHQIIINLCSNAKDAVSDKEGTITIELSNKTLDERSVRDYTPLGPGRYVELKVSDDGCGIEQYYVPKIFDPYFTTKDVNKGTGIGLAVVYGIVKGHSGLIHIESEAGKGTVFTILLPSYEEKILQEQDQVHALPRGSETILLVDDEPMILGLGVQRLEHLGYTVRASTDPFKALNLFKAEPSTFDLVITDMAMPRMTGEKLITAILEIRPQIPTILCTGYSEGIDEERAREIGISLFMLKPIEALEFATCVRNVIDQNKKQGRDN